MSVYERKLQGSFNPDRFDHLIEADALQVFKEWQGAIGGRFSTLDEGEGATHSNAQFGRKISAVGFEGEAFDLAHDDPEPGVKVLDDHSTVDLMVLPPLPGFTDFLI